MTVEELKSAMHEGVVEFTFMKKNGTERVAHGTLNFNKIVELGGNLPNGNGTPKDSDTIAYFDTDKNAWRSFKEDFLIK